MFVSQQVRVGLSTLWIAILGSLAACSDMSSPTHMRAGVDGPSMVAIPDSMPGLVAEYSFNETSGYSVVDGSTFANNGTFGSGVTRTTAGRFGGALQFNGNGRVTIPSTASLRLTNGMTLEAWVNPSVVDASWRNVIYKGDDNYYLMSSSTRGGRPAGGASFGNTSATTEAYAPSALAANTWSHLAVTYDGSTIRLYVNGTQVSSLAKRGTYATSNNPLQIGGNTFYTQFFRGRIDEVRVYNRAITATEIQRDMNTAISGAATADSSAPVIAIAAPTADSTYTTSAAAVSMSGTARDNKGIMHVRWSNDRGGAGMADGTTNWSVASIPLQPGTNVLTVTAEDSARNTATKTLTAISNAASSSATQLALTTQPSATAPSGAVFSQQPVVELRDATGAPVRQSGMAVTATIAGGGGALGGTATVTTDANGVAMFTDLSITGAVGSRTLNFMSGSLSPATSSGIAITAGAAAKLVISSIASQTANAPFNVTVTLTDASGNAVANSGASGVVTLSRQSGTGTLGGTMSGTMANGASAITITGVTYSAAESGVSIRATGSGTGASVSGKTGVSNAFTVAAAAGGGSGNSYATSFVGVESPISEGGRWINGKTNGLDWSDVWSTGGQAIGRQTSASYTDATALLTGTWAADQQVTATVFNTAPVGESCYPEVELRLRSSISAHVNRGYEVSFKVSQSGSAYMIIVRWNGPLGNFTYLGEYGGAQYGVKNGDVISAKMVGSVITVYKNGSVMGSASDNTYTSGLPGMGFNLENAPTGCSGSNDKYGYTHFSAVDGVK